MKVGDTVVCKRMCVYELDKPHIKFRKGESYHIGMITKEGNMFIYSTKPDGLWFNVTNKMFLNDFEYYFYSIDNQLNKHL